MRRLGRHGKLVPVARYRALLPGALDRLAAIAEALAAEAENGLITPGAYRDRTGIGRNQVIEILEYFDERQFTARLEAGRTVLKPRAEIFGTGEA